MGEHKEFPEEISDKNKEFVQKLNILHLKSKEETLSSKLEDEVNNLTTPEKEELKKNLEKEIQNISFYEFNSLLKDLDILLSETNKPNSSAEDILIKTETHSLEYQQQKLPVLPITFQNPKAQKIYGLLYAYHLLSNGTPLIEKTTTILVLQNTFLTIKNKHLKERYPQTRAMRNFNPGNLRTQGDLGKDKGNYAIFSSLEKGRNALMNNIERWKKWESKIYEPSFTLIQFFTKYAAPKVALNYATKAAQIMSQLTGIQISPNKTPIKNIPTKAFATAIAAQEDGDCYKALKNEGLIK